MTDALLFVAKLIVAGALVAVVGWVFGALFAILLTLTDGRP